MSVVEHATLDQLFLKARSIHQFLPAEVSNETLRELYTLVRQGPTGFNAQPARFLFVRSPEAKQQLAPALSSSNRDKTIAAPLNVIIAYDENFHDELPEQFPAYDARSFFINNPSWIEPTARTNATLQAGYLFIAARALGLDVGPMSGFDNAKVDEIFFAGTSWKSLLLANIGYGDHSSVKPVGPRLDFGKAVSVL
ncbi:malonic semialdehyde reductase [Cellvibrio polysaccharolyticus]|uniref:Malonic semialdehyde reductase n=1 Tax=Cellvibrio polysaccharolyticus TaxID=2082724 RepID=A0A928YV23_9GAMM|nr:malonic semialdehyde reductase [Cellvibrio polysaccharolyticus]MBE8716608.1 malonic semialdehyde reductase [Cellvibrio polysaccharolyticus]